MASSTTLRVITNRLTTTPVNELPYVVSFLASSLSDCAEFNPQSRTGKINAADANEAVQINKLKARLTSLLQDRSVEGRWASVVLIKALLEAGGWDALRDCGPWVRGLLANLTKPNPTSTKTLSIITLSRIFQLTYQYPSLVREITTPNLPGFITACLNLVSAQKAISSGISRTESSLLEIVLAAFTGLIGRHPTVFRPFVGQLRKLVVPILASTSQNSSISTNVLRLAQQVFVSLHNCAPKNTAAEQWANDCKKTVSAIHQAADHVFRSVVEQWESADPNHRHRKESKDVSDSPQADEPDALDLPSWQGLLSGTNRIRTLLELLNQFLSVRTASMINYPLGAILNLISRLTSVTVPNAGEENTQANSEFSRDERVSLFMELPRIHAACIELFRSIISTFESGSLSVILTILEQTLWLFEAESFNSSVRQSSYLLLGTILPLIGRSLPKQMVFDMSSLVRECCRDLVPPENTSSIPDQPKNSSTAGASKNGQLNMNIDIVLNSSVKESNTQKGFYLEGPGAVATTLLPLLYNYLPTEYIPMSLRTEMERAAILTGNRTAMVASIMNPVPPIKGRRPIPSIVPFVSRRYAKDMQVECLMRPRMPNLPGNGTDQYDAEDFEEQEAYKEADVQTISNLGAQRLSSNFAKDSLEVSTTATSIPALRPLAQNKRLLPEDSEMTNTANLQPASVSFTENKSPESKKARLQVEETSVTTKISVPVVIPSDSTTTAEIIPPPATTALLGDRESSAGTLDPVNSFPVKTANGGATSNLIDADSDDEMPTLNLEPDTDEDEDE